MFINAHTSFKLSISTLRDEQNQYEHTVTFNQQFKQNPNKFKASSGSALEIVVRTTQHTDTHMKKVSEKESC